MRIMLKIKIETPALTYDFELSSKMTFISGSSGTGKTTMIGAIKAALLKSGSKLTLSDDSYTAVIVDATNWGSVLRDTKDEKCVYFMDELDKVFTQKFIRLYTKNTKSFFVSITRVGFGDFVQGLEQEQAKEQLSVYEDGGSGSKSDVAEEFEELLFGTYSVFDLEFDSTTRTARLVPHYTFFAPDFYVLPNKVVTEDSMSGFSFFKSIYSATESIEGNGQIDYYLEHCNKTDNVLLLVDLAVLGTQAENLFAAAALTGNVNNVFIHSDYRSFEYMLLNSRLLQKLQERTGVSLLPTNDEICASKSDERIAAVILKRVTKGYPFEYRKSDTALACFVSDCGSDECKRVSRKAKNACQAGISGDKLTELFAGTEFENLIKILQAADAKLKSQNGG